MIIASKSLHLCILKILQPLIAFIPIKILALTFSFLNINTWDDDNDDDTEVIPADISRINVQFPIILFKERDYLIKSVHTFVLNNLSSLHSRKKKT